MLDGRGDAVPLRDRQRRYYYITNKGQRVLAEKVSQWQDYLTAVNLIIQ